jgi:glutathione synthase/RimK-type ligase-like ATP-grasp enzyme/gamma-glutamyl:cysteine ligase YbdK (ATP-grasp superfamily)
VSRILVVVSTPADAPDLPAEQVVTADRYLEAAQGGADDPERVVINLCRSYRYRTKGFYTSLLADARGQQVVPSVETIEALADPFRLFRALREAGVACCAAAERPVRRRGRPETARNGGDADAETVTALFGVCEDPRFAAAALRVYREWPVPALSLGFVREEDEWRLAEAVPLPPQRLAPADRAALSALLRRGSFLRRSAPPAREAMRASIAVLVDPDDAFSPSSPETIDRLERVASRLNVHVERIGLDDVERLGEYDALFIRALTGVREPAFQFALRAEALAMPVVDDPQSIVRCSNKVFLEELLRREQIPTPRTVVATARTSWEVLRELGLPLVIKLPDGSFSAAVHKVASEAEYRERSAEMLRRSPLIIAQEFLPTEYDWRITVLDGRVLFAAKYFMARGHWQIRSDHGGRERYGRVEAVPRAEAPREVVEIALRAAGLIGDGLYGVDLKETAAGPVVIEVNDNPNLDVGYDDAADGSAVYEDLVQHFVRRIEAAAPAAAAEVARERPATLKEPIGTRGGRDGRRHYRPFEVAGMELEYAVVDRDLNAVSLVEPAFRVLAGRPTSDVELGAIGFSNEIADHVFELKTLRPTASLAEAEMLLAEGVRRFADVLKDGWGARLMPTGMHPWLDPRGRSLWQRSGRRIYRTYERLFDVRTHGWMNVHAAHLNLPFGREEEAVAMHNAAALLIPYLPALAASSPMHDGELQGSADSRLAWILRHQDRIPETCGEIVPEAVDDFSDYRRRILQPMYAALDRYPDAGALRAEFLNARGAILRFARKSMEIRVLDTQECPKLDVAIAVFARSALKHLSRRAMSGRLPVPDHALLVEDFRATVAHGGAARVHAPFLPRDAERGDDGRLPVRTVLGALLDDARRAVRRDEAQYLELVERIVETGSLAERIRAALQPYESSPDEEFTEAARRVYIELCDCLEANEPWRGRGWTG